MPSAERASRPGVIRPSALRDGELRLRGLLPHASNYTFLAEIASPDGTVPVVYKPRAGESPLWDFPDGTLCHREVAAYLVASELGWPNVPPTVLRDGPHGEGAVQLFVPAHPAENYFTLRDDDRYRDDFLRIAAFDVVAGNGDRKAGHCLLGDDGLLWAVDHGLCFHPRPVLRTVIWEFAGHDVPEEILVGVRQLESALRGGPLRDGLLEHLEAEEIDAAADRTAALARAGRYPEPGPGRSVPWPPV
jgi:uncharacterized repeat protein (TIGR03843 family)